LESDTDGSKADPMAIDYANHRRTIESFLDGLDGEESYPLDAVESRKAVEIIEAIYESAEKNEPACLS
jgi:predicted dehydrogenase